MDAGLRPADAHFQIRTAEERLVGLRLGIEFKGHQRDELPEVHLPLVDVEELRGMERQPPRAIGQRARLRVGLVTIAPVGRAVGPLLHRFALSDRAGVEPYRGIGQPALVGGERLHHHRNFLGCHTGTGQILELKPHGVLDEGFGNLHADAAGKDVRVGEGVANGQWRSCSLPYQARTAFQQGELEVGGGAVRVRDRQIHPGGAARGDHQQRILQNGSAVGRLRIGAELELLQVAPAVAIRIHQRVRAIGGIESVELLPPVRKTIAVGIRRGNIRSEIDPQLLAAIGKTGGDFRRLPGVQQAGRMAIDRGGLDGVAGRAAANDQGACKLVRCRRGFLIDLDAVGKLPVAARPAQRNIQIKHMGRALQVDQFHLQGAAEQLVGTARPELDHLAVDDARRLGQARGSGNGHQGKGQGDPPCGQRGAAGISGIHESIFARF